MIAFNLPTGLRDWVRDARANVATLFALTAPVVLIAIGSVVDYGNAVSTKAKMQAALDAAVLAGSNAAASGTQTTGSNTAAAYFMADGGQNWTGVTTNGFPFTTDATGAVTLSGTATYSMPSLFASFTGHTSIRLTVASSAKTTSSTTTTPVCILLTNTTASQSLLVNSGAKVNGPSCEMDVASTGNPAAMINSGSTISLIKTCIQGTNITNNGGTVANLTTGCSTVSNPYVGQLPLPPTTTCTGAYANGGNFSGNTTLSPGVYCGWFNFNSPSNVTFLPGVYVIKNGGWNVNGGTFNGSGVTFYFADTSKIQFNSGMNLTLSPPTSGTYSGILFYEPDGLASSQFVFNDSVSETMSGLIYMPSRQIVFNSTSNQTTPSITVVANTAIFNSLNWNLTPSSQWTLGHTTTSAGGGTPVLTQ